MNFNWNNILGTLVAGLIVYIFLIMFVFPKHTVRYDLAGYSINRSCITLIRDIENHPDELVDLPKEVNIQQAVRICDSLNLQLKKYTIK